MEITSGIGKGGEDEHFPICLAIAIHGGMSALASMMPQFGKPSRF